MRAPAPLVATAALLAITCCASCAPDGAAPESAALPSASPAEEFLDLASKLRAGSNPYVGRGALEELRARVEAEETVELQVELALAELRHGETDRALATIEAAIAADPEPASLLYRIRALVHLRRAEVANCIARHNAECCIFPLRGGGVHAEQSHARSAASDYERYLELEPEDLAARWLLNVAHMALGSYPDAVPATLRVDALRFEVESELTPFKDVAPALGVDAMNLCGGVVADDFDGDGRIDIITSSFDPSEPLRYYRNGGDGSFEDRSRASGLSDQLGGLNCIGADYDNDGDVDVLVLRGAWLFADGHIRNSLLRNDGRGNFTDVTHAAGLALPAYPTQAAAWGDLDNDGDLDLYVGNECVNDDPERAPFSSQLFLNQGDGTFIDRAEAAGVENNEYCKSVAAGDFDNDGDLDLFVSNFGPNRLYRNEGDGTFVDVARQLGVAQPERSFAAWFFDYDQDGRLDLFVTTYEAPIEAVAADYLGRPYHARHPALYRNTGQGFENRTLRARLDHAYLPMGANFGDIDGDGWLDIYLGTGDPNLESLMPNRMLRNAGGRHFQDVTVAGGFGHLQKGHGIAFADFDDDGDQDIYHQLGGFFPGDRFHNALFLNPGNTNRFVTIELVGTRSNTSGYGARLELDVRGEDGTTRTLHRAVGSVSSFGGSPRRQEIGLGAATAIGELRVTWPSSGEVQRFSDLPLDRWIRITEGEGAPELEQRAPLVLSGG